MKKIITIAISALIALFLLVGALYCCVEWVAFDHSFYAQQFAALNIEQASGLGEGQLQPLTSRIIDYLSGRGPDLNMQVTVDGVQQPAFGSREIKHMEDVRELFKRGGRIRLLSWGLCATLGILLILLGGAARDMLYGGLGGCAGFVAALLGMAVWGLIDFDSLFTMFHVVSFSNDLWLLDPAHELLIRLVPLRFFIACAVRVMLYMLAWLAALAGTMLVILRNIAVGRIRAN